MNGFVIVSTPREDEVGHRRGQYLPRTASASDIAAFKVKSSKPAQKAWRKPILHDPDAISQKRIKGWKARAVDLIADGRPIREHGVCRAIGDCPGGLVCGRLVPTAGDLKPTPVPFIRAEAHERRKRAVKRTPAALIRVHDPYAPTQQPVGWTYTLMRQ